MEELAALLAACAEAAAEAFGKQLANDFMDAVLSNLATKDDLVKAVADIERYIDQVIDKLEEDMIGAGLYAALARLADFKTSRHIHSEFLTDAGNELAHSFGQLTAQSMHDPNVFRRYFVAIISLVTADIAVLVQLSVYNDKSYIGTLVDHIKKDSALIEVCINKVEDFEHETAGPIWMEIVRPTGGPKNPSGSFGYRGHYNQIRKRYGGSRTVSGEWYGEGGAQDASGEITAIRNRDVKRMTDEGQWRVDHVYSPARKCLKAALDMKLPST
jgi:hypothetical protein